MSGSLGIPQRRPYSSSAAGDTESEEPSSAAAVPTTPPHKRVRIFALDISPKLYGFQSAEDPNASLSSAPHSKDSAIAITGLDGAVFGNGMPQTLNIPFQYDLFETYFPGFTTMTWLISASIEEAGPKLARIKAQHDEAVLKATRISMIVLREVGTEIFRAFRVGSHNIMKALQGGQKEIARGALLTWLEQNFSSISSTNIVKKGILTSSDLLDTLQKLHSHMCTANNIVHCPSISQVVVALRHLSTIQPEIVGLHGIIFLVLHFLENASFLTAASTTLDDVDISSLEACERGGFGKLIQRVAGSEKWIHQPLIKKIMAEWETQHLMPILKGLVAQGELDCICVSKETHDRDISMLKKQMQQTEDELASIKKQRTNQVQELNTEIRKHKNTLKAKLTTENDLQQTREKLQQTTENLTEVEKAHTRQAQQVGQLQGALKRAENQCIATEQERRHWEEEASDLKDNVKKLQSDVQRHAYVITQLRLENQVMKADMQKLRDDNSALQASNRELQASNRELQASNSELQASNSELQASNSALQDEVNILRAENANLHRRIDHLESVVDDLKSMLQNFMKAAKGEAPSA